MSNKAPYPPSPYPPKGPYDEKSSPKPKSVQSRLLKTGSLFVAQGLKFDSAILQYGPSLQTF